MGKKIKGVDYKQTSRPDCPYCGEALRAFVKDSGELTRYLFCPCWQDMPAGGRERLSSRKRR